MTLIAPTVSDVSAISTQLGREPRDLVGVAHRCACGNPDVVATAPRLSDGSPFPTFFYLTCPRATAMIGTLEAAGVMGEMTQQLAENPDLRLRYERAHQAYLAARAAYGEVDEVAQTSAGGMPTRVKCLHALVAHALAAGPGVNPLGDRAIDLLPAWGLAGSCTGSPGDAEREESA